MLEKLDFAGNSLEEIYWVLKLCLLF